MLGLLVALTLNGRHSGHKGDLTSLMRLLNGLSPTKRLKLEMPKWRERGGYDRVQRLHQAPNAALDFGSDLIDEATSDVVRCDWDWRWRLVLRAPIPDDVLTAMAGRTGLVVDSTEVETCARFQFGGENPDYDGEAVPPDSATPTKAKKVPLAMKDG